MQSVEFVGKRVGSLPVTTQTHYFQSRQVSPIQQSNVFTSTKKLPRKQKKPKLYKKGDYDKFDQSVEFVDMERFAQYKAKVKKEVEEQAYESVTEYSSLSSLDEDKPAKGKIVDNSTVHYKMVKFYKHSTMLQRKGIVDLVQIAKKAPEKRDKDDIQHLQTHLKFAVPFFYDYQADLLAKIAEKLVFQEFVKGEYLIKQGDVGDEMFILMKGKCQVLGRKVDNKGKIDENELE